MLPGVGVFGTGPLAREIVIILKRCGFPIAAVWSRALKDAERFAKDFDISLFTNKVDGLLLKPEVGCVVIVCTPHLQSPIAVKAMGIGKHVIATWPAGTSQLEVLKMVKGATYYPSLLSMMCHGLRFLPAYTTMRRHINSGHIGQLYLFEVKVHCRAEVDEYSWKCDSLMGGGALSLHGSYIVDVIAYLSGKRAKCVSGMMKTYVRDQCGIQGVREITCDDFCTFQMELEDGVSVCCTVNTHVDGQFTHEVIAVGSKGRLSARDLDLYVQLNDQPEELLLYKEPATDAENLDAISTEAGRVPFMTGRCSIRSDVVVIHKLPFRHHWLTG